MKEKLLWSIFWASVAVFAIVMGIMFTPLPMIGYVLFAVLGVLFGLGVTLLVLAARARVKKMLKAFLLLTGASAAGMPVFVVLHNLVYALFIDWFGEGFWSGIGGDEPVFFILAILVSPIAFLVGAIGSIVIGARGSWLLKKSPSKARAKGRTKRKRA